MDDPQGSSWISGFRVRQVGLLAYFLGITVMMTGSMNWWPWAKMPIFRRNVGSTRLKAVGSNNRCDGWTDIIFAEAEFRGTCRLSVKTTRNGNGRLPNVMSGDTVNGRKDESWVQSFFLRCIFEFYGFCLRWVTWCEGVLWYGLTFLGSVDE